MKKINESFLHFLWKNQHLTGVTFHTADKFELHVIDPGQDHADSGPDFFNAKVRIDGTTWAGNVELHINASDWIKHGHNDNQLYDTVILHVVYFNDCEITRNDGSIIPTAILRFPVLLWDKYENLQKNKNWLPCQDHLKNLQDIHFVQWTSALMIENLEKRYEIIRKNDMELHSHWDAVLMRSLIRSFGMPVNKAPFEMLSYVIPYELLLRYKSESFRLEALLFGQAGFLELQIPRDKYMQELGKEFMCMKGKLPINKVPVQAWRFMRMRPSSFPTVRISQLASLIKKSIPIYEKLLSKPTIKEISRILHADAGDYWNTHYTFGKPTKSRKKSTGQEFINMLITNSVVPFIYYFGVKNNKPLQCDHAISLLEELPAENNVILKNWGKFGIKCSNAFESQAILFLYKNYCREKRCLECQFGNAFILNGTKKE